MKKILYINHGLTKECGVHSLGVRHFNSIKNIKDYEILYYEIDSIDQYFQICKKENPDGVIFNYMKFTSPWINSNINLYKCKKYCVPHLFYKDNFYFEEDPNKSIFDYFILLDKNSSTTDKVFKTDRPLIEYVNNNKSKNKIPTIGSFGFAFNHKFFNKVVANVNENFDIAQINIHMPKAYFDTSDNTRDVINSCIHEIKKPGIKLNITTDFIDEREVVERLSKNDINCLFFQLETNLGISSSLDYLISAQKPILITGSEMFRAFSPELPIYPSVSIKNIYNNFENYKSQVENIYKNSINSISKNTKDILDRI
jgi:hypothetical protein